MVLLLVSLFFLFCLHPFEARDTVTQERQSIDDTEQQQQQQEQGQGQEEEKEEESELIKEQQENRKEQTNKRTQEKEAKNRRMIGMFQTVD